MKRYIILGVIVIVIVAGVLALGWFFPNLFGLNKNENVNATNAVANTNQAAAQNKNINKAPALNMNLSQLQGSIKVNKSVTYKEVEFKVLSADKLDEFENQKAENGNKLIILYLEKLTSVTAAEIFSWLVTDVKLHDSKNESYGLKGFNFAGESATEYATSYLMFEMPESGSGLSLNFGSGDSLEKIDLGF